MYCRLIDKILFLDYILIKYCIWVSFCRSQVWVTIQRTADGNCLCWWHHSCLEDMKSKAVNLPQPVPAIWIWQLPPAKSFPCEERFLEAPFQAPNMLKSSGYMLLINENFNSPALIVKNTAIIPGSSKLLMRFRSSTISIDVWRGGSFLSVLSVHTPEQPVLNSCWNWVWGKFKQSGYYVTHMYVERVLIVNVVM